MDLLFRILIPGPGGSPGPGPLDSLHRMTASSNCLTMGRWWNLTTLALNLGFSLSSLWTLIQCLCMKEDLSWDSYSPTCSWSLRIGALWLSPAYTDLMILLSSSTSTTSSFLSLSCLVLVITMGSGGKGRVFHNTVSFCVSMSAKQERHSIRYVKLFWVQETFSLPLLLWSKQFSGLEHGPWKTLLLISNCLIVAPLFSTTLIVSPVSFESVASVSLSFFIKPPWGDCSQNKTDTGSFFLFTLGLVEGFLLEVSLVFCFGLLLNQFDFPMRRALLR